MQAQLITALHNVQTAVEANTRTTVRMENTLQQGYKVPVSLVLIVCAAWLFNNAKIAEWTCFSLILIGLFPWYGEAIRAVLGRSERRDPVVESAKLGILLILGCSAWFH